MWGTHATTTHLHRQKRPPLGRCEALGVDASLEFQNSKDRPACREGYGMPILAPLRAMTYDAIGWTIFLIAGIASHRPSAGGLATAIASSLLLASAWFCCAQVTAFYEHPITLSRTATIWVSATCIGLVVRTLLRWHALVPAFAVVSLVLSAVVVFSWRLIWMFRNRTPAS